MKKIILFYKYIHISDPVTIKQWLEELCIQLALKGRIILAKEGINGTLEGEIDNLEKYKNAMQANQLFTTIDFKESDIESTQSGTCFPRLSIKIRDSIVHFGRSLINVYPTKTHKTAQEVHHLLDKNPEDLIIFDTRNQYEWEIGKFNNALTPQIQNFRDLPDFIDQNIEKFRNKQVLMYCTGGVRCEKTAIYLQEKNIAKEVFQLEGGIHRYIEQFPNGYFRGKNYVFDGRISVRVNDDILGHCFTCHTSSDEYTNCLNTRCNLHFITCKNCLKHFNNLCSEKCRTIVSENPTFIKKIDNSINHNPLL